MRGPTEKPIKTVTVNGKSYRLFKNGALWTSGPHAYHCGYVLNSENILTAIDAHEEEVRVMMAAARREFS